MSQMLTHGAPNQLPLMSGGNTTGNIYDRSIGNMGPMGIGIDNNNFPTGVLPQQINAPPPMSGTTAVMRHNSQQMLPQQPSSSSNFTSNNQQQYLVPQFQCPKRPNHGADGRQIALRANHFQVSCPGGTIHHYQIDIQPDKCPRKVNRFVNFLLKIMFI